MKKLILGILLASTLAATITATAAETKIPPQIGPLQYTPTSPTVQSTITFKVNVTGTPTQINLWYHECKPGMCHSDQNITMTKNISNPQQFEAHVTLGYSDSTYVIAHVLLDENGSWLAGNDVNITLSPEQNGNTGKKSPGFEAVPVIAAVAIALIILRKKRSQ
jgi:hypothetical protein